MTSRWQKARVAAGILLAAGASVATAALPEYESTASADKELAPPVPTAIQGSLRIGLDDKALSAAWMEVTIAPAECGVNGLDVVSARVGEETRNSTNLCTNIPFSPRVRAASCLPDQQWCTFDLPFEIVFRSPNAPVPSGYLRLRANVRVVSEAVEDLGVVTVAFQ